MTKLALPLKRTKLASSFPSSSFWQKIQPSGFSIRMYSILQGAHRRSISPPHLLWPPERERGKAPEEPRGRLPYRGPELAGGRRCFFYTPFSFAIAFARLLVSSA